MRRAVGFALVVALSLARPGAAQTLVPRLAPSKPPRTLVGPAHATDHVIVKLREGTGVRLRGGRFVARGVDVGALAKTLRAYGLGTADVERVFDRPEAALDAEREAFEARSGRALADLNLYYRVRLPAGTAVASLCDALNALPLVELATPGLRPFPPPVDLAPPTPDFSPDQGYRDAAHGIGVPPPGLYPGSDGDGRTLVDVEYSWLLEHEDLELPPSAILDPATPTDPFPEDEANHGTAVLGELVGGDNGYGVTGLVPRSTLRLAPASTEEHGYDVGRAVSLATGLLTEGDVILIEQQICVCGQPCREDSQDGLGPVEGFQPFYDAIATATAAGIVVVEAAGNGNVNLDGIDCQGLFDRTNRDSGAFIAGAGDPSDNSLLSFSSHGSRVDLQGWGRLVVTTSYGDLFGRPPGPTDLRQRYTIQFSGTSSAAAIVAGAALAVQGARTAAGLPALAPVALRQLLVDTGRPQGPRPTGHVGPLPNLPAALTRAVPCAAPTVIPAAGGTVTGRTTGQGALRGCGGDGPERVFQWTPPASGTATIETCGSNFDTVLSVRRDACATGSEIACADDVCGRQERVTPEVTAGIPYFIIVDGFRSAEGEFVLTVTPPPPQATTTTTATTGVPTTLGPTTTTTTAPACVTGAPCDDGDACTVDACDPRAGCISSPRPEGEPAGVACAADNALAVLHAPPAPACSGRCPGVLEDAFEKVQALLDASATAPGRGRCARTLRKAMVRIGTLRHRIRRLAAHGRLDTEARALALVRETTRLGEGAKRLVAARYCALR